MTTQSNATVVAESAQRARTIALASALLLSAIGVVLLARWIDAHPQSPVIATAQEDRVTIG